MIGRDRCAKAVASALTRAIAPAQHAYLCDPSSRVGMFEMIDDGFRRTPIDPIEEHHAVCSDGPEVGIFGRVDLRVRHGTQHVHDGAEGPKWSDRLLTLGG